jgi:hypothetical protein
MRMLRPLRFFGLIVSVLSFLPHSFLPKIHLSKR